MSKFICIIPARAGSKRVKNKNILKIKNKLLIQYTIDLALKIKKFDHIIVSSDSSIIKDLIVKKYEKEVKFILRPKKISQDNSSTESCISHVIKCLRKYFLLEDYIFLLEPTSPLRRKSTILKAMKLIDREKPNSVISVYKNKSLPGNLDKQNNFIYLIKNQSRSSIKRNFIYFETGVFWAFSINYFIKYNKIISKYPKCIEVDYPENIDINGYDDLNKVKKYI